MNNKTITRKRKNKPSIKDMVEESESAIRKMRMEMMDTAIVRYREQNGNLERLLVEANSTIKLQNIEIKRLSELEAQVENLPKWIRWIFK